MLELFIRTAGGGPAGPSGAPSLLSHHNQGTALLASLPRYPPPPPPAPFSTLPLSLARSQQDPQQEPLMCLCTPGFLIFDGVACVLPITMLKCRFRFGSSIPPPPPPPPSPQLVAEALLRIVLSAPPHLTHPWPSVRIAILQCLAVALAALAAPHAYLPTFAPLGTAPTGTAAARRRAWRATAADAATKQTLHAEGAGARAVAAEEHASLPRLESGWRRARPPAPVEGPPIPVTTTHHGGTSREPRDPILHLSDDAAISSSSLSSSYEGAESTTQDERDSRISVAGEPTAAATGDVTPLHHGTAGVRERRHTRHAFRQLALARASRSLPRPIGFFAGRGMAGTDAVERAIGSGVHRGIEGDFLPTVDKVWPAVVRRSVAPDIVPTEDWCTMLFALKCKPLRVLCLTCACHYRQSLTYPRLPWLA